MMRVLFAVRPGELEIGHIPIPRPREYEALVRMEACAICNSTDHKLMMNEFVPGPFPVALGHEVIGTVVEAGDGVVNFKPGDTVFRQTLGDEHIPGEGRSCWGGFAEYGLVTDLWAKEGVCYGPSPLPHSQQKLLIDVPTALGCAMITLMETLDCISEIGVSGKKVAVVGTGPVGQAFALFARLLGAEVTFAFGRRRRYEDRFLRLCRCDGYVVGDEYPAQVRDTLEQGGFDVVMEAVGSKEALERCLELAGSRGGVYAYGIPPLSCPYTPEQLEGGRVKNVGAREGRVQAKLVEFIRAGEVKLGDWVDCVLPMERYEEAFRLVESKEAQKVVLVP